MSIFQLIFELLQAQKKGLLITLINGTPSFQAVIGKKALWFTDELLMNLSDELALKEYASKNFFIGLVKDEKLAFFTERLDHLCAEIAVKNRFHRQKIQVFEEWVEIILEPLLPEPRLLIFGCGHVGHELAQMAHRLELSLTVVDDRPFFANPKRFPLGVQVICDSFAQAIKDLAPGINDSLVIVTRGHAYDRICLEELAGTEVRYLGMIGSKRRVGTLKAELEKTGICPQWLAKLHAPIGLKIGAETPAEIAVSILAEVIKVWRKGDLDESRVT